MNVNIFITDFDSSIAREKNKKIGACCNVTMPRHGSGPGSRNIQVLCGMQGNTPREHKQSLCAVGRGARSRSGTLGFPPPKPQTRCCFYLFLWLPKSKPNPPLSSQCQAELGESFSSLCSSLCALLKSCTGGASLRQQLFPDTTW